MRQTVWKIRGPTFPNGIPENLARPGINTKGVNRPPCIAETPFLSPSLFLPLLCPISCASQRHKHIRSKATLRCAWLGVLKKKKRKRKRKRRKKNLESWRMEQSRVRQKGWMNIWCPGSDLWSIKRSGRVQRPRFEESLKKSLQAFHFAALSRELLRVFTRPVHNLCTSFGRGFGKE